MASWPYSEHDGKNRHGDGRPSAPRWYHSIAASIIRCQREPEASAVTPPVPPPIESVDRTCVRPTWPGRRSGAGPAGAANAGRGRSGWLGCGAGSGSVAPPTRTRGRTRTLHTWRSSRGRDTRYTREPIGGSAYHHAPTVRTRRVRGSDGSSRQTGAALGAAVLQDGTPGAGAHPSPKAVLLGPAMGVGLKCTLHVVLLEDPASSTAGSTRSLWRDASARSRPDKARGDDGPAATRTR